MIFILLFAVNLYGNTQLLNPFKLDYFRTLDFVKFTMKYQHSNYWGELILRPYAYLFSIMVI